MPTIQISIQLTISVSLLISARSASISAFEACFAGIMGLACCAGVCTLDGTAEGAGDGVLLDALFTNPWKILPNTLDEPGLDNGGCSVCARIDGVD